MVSCGWRRRSKNVKNWPEKPLCGRVEEGSAFRAQPGRLIQTNYKGHKCTMHNAFQRPHVHHVQNHPFAATNHEDRVILARHTLSQTSLCVLSVVGVFSNLRVVNTRPCMYSKGTVYAFGLPETSDTHNTTLNIHMARRDLPRLCSMQSNSIQFNASATIIELSDVCRKWTS